MLRRNFSKLFRLQQLNPAVGVRVTFEHRLDLAFLCNNEGEDGDILPIR